MARTTTAAALVLLLLGGPAARAQHETQPPQDQKLIEWGWDEPDTTFLRANIAQMEQFPSDGLVFHVTGT